MNSLSTGAARRQSAQGLVEFALVLPFLLLLLMGIIDFGWLIFNYVQLQNGLQEALRYGSVPSFTGPDSYRDCRGIFNRVETTAPWSGVQDSNIHVFYDHGYSTGFADTGTDVNGVPYVIDKCPAAPSPGYSIPDPMNNGDRLRIEISVNVRFLTPFLRTWVKDGLTFQYSGSRTLLPSGVRI